MRRAYARSSAGRLRDRRRASTLQREVLRGHKRDRRRARVAISMVRPVALVSVVHEAVVHELPPPIPHAGCPGCRRRHDTTQKILGDVMYLAGAKRIRG